jgi:hypothetical protein
MIDTMMITFALLAALINAALVLTFIWLACMLLNND